MGKIKQIDVLVHPDFYQMAKPELPLHPRQLELRRQWEERVNLLRNNQEAILIYFSNMPKDELMIGLLENQSWIPNKIKREDILRIKRYKKMLGDQFILFSKLDLPKKADLIRTLKSRGFDYEPEKTIIQSYGEAFEACVTAWGWHVKEELGIPDSNYNFFTENMSLTFADGDEINRWRSRLERA